MKKGSPTLSAITKVQALVLTLALIFSALFIAYAVASYTNAGIIEEKREGILEIPLHNTLTIRVQRTTGETETYVKEGDPWTQNLLALMANIMLGRGYSSPLSIYKTDGTAFNYIDTAYSQIASNLPDPMLAIQIGRSNYTFLPSQYSLITPIATFNVTSSGVSVSDNGVDITATFTSSWTASEDVTVWEVGLILEVCTYNTNTYSRVLLARDVLSTPVSLASGDVISVSYQVSFTYGYPPFLKNFAAVLFNHIFGLKYYGRARAIYAMDGTSVTIDYGLDYGYGGSYLDNIKEPSSLIYDGEDIASYIPSKSMISIIATRVDNVRVNVQVVNSTHAMISYTGSASFSSPSRVSAVGLSFKTDTDTTYTNTFKEILILYFPLNNPLNVPAGSSVKFTFTIWLRLAPS